MKAWADKHHSVTLERNLRALILRGKFSDILAASNDVKSLWASLALKDEELKDPKTGIASSQNEHEVMEKRIDVMQKEAHAMKAEADARENISNTRFERLERLLTSLSISDTPATTTATSDAQTQLSEHWHQRPWMTHRIVSRKVF